MYGIMLAYLPDARGSTNGALEDASGGSSVKTFTSSENGCTSGSSLGRALCGTAFCCSEVGFLGQFRAIGGGGGTYTPGKENTVEDKIEPFPGKA